MANFALGGEHAKVKVRRGVDGRSRARAAQARAYRARRTLSHNARFTMPPAQKPRPLGERPLPTGRSVELAQAKRRAARLLKGGRVVMRLASKLCIVGH